MKRKLLRLQKETVRRLDAKQLGRVGGGIVKTYLGDACSATNVQCSGSDVCSQLYCSGVTCGDECNTYNGNC